MTTVELGDGKRYTVDGLIWTGPDAEIVGLLNRARPIYGPSVPSAELAEAGRALELFGGELVKTDVETDFEPGVIY